LSSLEPVKPFIDMLRMLAQLLDSMAEVEEEHGRRFDEILKEILSPTRLLELHKKLPPDVYSELMASLLRLATLSSSVQNPLMLPTTEKKRVASELRKVVASLESVIEKVRELKR
jgi:rubrerythrin